MTTPASSQGIHQTLCDFQSEWADVQQFVEQLLDELEQLRSELQRKTETVDSERARLDEQQTALLAELQHVRPLLEELAGKNGGP